MKRKAKQWKPDVGEGVAWEFFAVGGVSHRPGNHKWIICSWAEPDKKRLTLGPKPSSEARIRKVRIIREKDYQKLMRIVRAYQKSKSQ